MNQLDIVVWDLETGGLNPESSEILQIAGRAYNCRTLEPYPGDFMVYLRPDHPDRVDDAALKVNKLTLDFLAKNGVDQRTGWTQFVDWVNTFNKKKTKFGAPISAGKNVRDFDMRFAEAYNRRHYKKPVVMFNHKTIINLEDYLFSWFENDPEMDSFAMDSIRPYFGLSGDKAHSADTDVAQTGELLMRFLKLHRGLRARKTKEGAPFINFKGCCA